MFQTLLVVKKTNKLELFLLKLYVPAGLVLLHSACFERHKSSHRVLNRLFFFKLKKKGNMDLTVSDLARKGTRIIPLFFFRAI